MEEQVWAKCNSCPFRSRADPRNGTFQLWNHLRKHHSDSKLHRIRAPQIGEGGEGHDMGEVVD
jgi:hypothetical protein